MGSHMVGAAERSARPSLPQFPADFRWGAATAAYQIEGAPAADGKGPSIWDTFVRRPGAIRDNSTGDPACDSYRRWPEDIDLLSWIGLSHYRFSVSWPRVLPTGSGPVNPAGLDHYDALVDGLLAAGITPLPTLYHWDLPQALEDAGGWLVPDTAERFADYAGQVADRLGDRVTEWVTINEPVMTTLQGYGTGELAPGRQLLLDAAPSAHWQLWAHALAGQAIKAGHPAKVGLANNHTRVIPASADPADLAAAAGFDLLYNRLFADPLLRGRYPDLTPLGVDPIEVSDEQLALINGSADFYGVNSYNPTRIGAAPADAPIPFTMPDFEGVPVTGFGWPVLPAEFGALLTDLHAEYGAALPPLVITENGCSYPDGDGPDALQDNDRIAYLHGHLRALHAAMDAGVQVLGYYVWSLLDNFEWADGYTQRFGLAHVDFATGTRTPRASAHWLRDQLAARG